MNYREIFAHVIDELDRATTKFPVWPDDPLHAVAIVGEECGELTKAVLEHVYEPAKSSRDDIRKEAIQAAAMIFRFIRSLEFYDFTPSEQHAWQEIQPRPNIGTTLR